MDQSLAKAEPSGLRGGPFSHSAYTVKRPFLTLFGRKFHVYSPDGQLVLYVRHKLMTLKDEWNIYADEAEQVPLIRVKARQAIALNLISDVFDAQTGERVGTVRNRGLKSIIRDTWDALDENDQPVGTFAEQSNSLLRRIIPMLLGHWQMELGGQVVGRLDQVFRFFVKEFTLDVSGAKGKADVRFVLACSLLALMREVQRESR